jgi:hypothetical protein
MLLRALPGKLKVGGDPAFFPIPIAGGVRSPAPADLFCAGVGGLLLLGLATALLGFLQRAPGVRQEMLLCGEPIWLFQTRHRSPHAAGYP